MSIRFTRRLEERCRAQRNVAGRLNSRRCGNAEATEFLRKAKKSCLLGRSRRQKLSERQLQAELELPRARGPIGAPYLGRRLPKGAGISGEIAWLVELRAVE